MNAEAKSNPTQTHAVIKLGIDAHFKWFYVGRQFDVATLQPVQKITLRGCCSDFEWIVRVQNGATFGATTEGTTKRQEGSPEVRGRILNLKNPIHAMPESPIQELDHTLGKAR